LLPNGNPRIKLSTHGRRKVADAVNLVVGVEESMRKRLLIQPLELRLSKSPVVEVETIDVYVGALHFPHLILKDRSRRSSRSKRLLDWQHLSALPAGNITISDGVGFRVDKMSDVGSLIWRSLWAVPPTAWSTEETDTPPGVSNLRSSARRSGYALFPVTS